MIQEMNIIICELVSLFLLALKTAQERENSKKISKRTQQGTTKHQNVLGREVGYIAHCILMLLTKLTIWILSRLFLKNRPRDRSLQLCQRAWQLHLQNLGLINYKLYFLVCGVFSIVCLTMNRLNFLTHCSLIIIDLVHDHQPSTLHLVSLRGCSW
jgi:hypothetical protein